MAPDGESTGRRCLPVTPAISLPLPPPVVAESSVDLDDQIPLLVLDISSPSAVDRHLSSSRGQSMRPLDIPDVPDLCGTLGPVGHVAERLDQLPGIGLSGSRIQCRPQRLRRGQLEVDGLCGERHGSIEGPPSVMSSTVCSTTTRCGHSVGWTLLPRVRLRPIATPPGARTRRSAGITISIVSGSDLTRPHTYPALRPKRAAPLPAWSKAAMARVSQSSRPASVW